MSESGEFAVDPPVSPVRVLSGHSDDQLPDFGFDWWPAPFRGRGFGPVPGDESPVPADHRCGFHDEEQLGQTAAIEHPRKQGEDRPIGLGELRSVDLALEHDELMAQREDLGVALIAGGEQPSEACEDEFREGGEQVHDSGDGIGQAVETPQNHWSDEFPKPLCVKGLFGGAVGRVALGRWRGR